MTPLSLYVSCRLRFQFYFLSTSSRQAGFLCASFTALQNKEHLTVCIDPSTKPLGISQFQLLTSPQGDPRGFAHPFFPASQGFTYKFVPGGPGFRLGQIFPEMNENLLNIFIFRGCFRRSHSEPEEKLSFLFTQIAFVP